MLAPLLRTLGLTLSTAKFLVTATPSTTPVDLQRWANGTVGPAAFSGQEFKNASFDTNARSHADAARRALQR